MLRINRMFTVLLLVALILSACQPFQLPAVQGVPALPAAEQSMPVTLAEPQGLRPDAPEYAKHGPFSVGYKPIVIGEETEHPLEASLWYPALNPAGAMEEVTYTINTKIPLEGMPATAPVYGHALLDAEIDPSAAPYPLVIYSHGFAANAAWVHLLLEHYASYGFIVLAPEHTEQFDFDWSEIPNASIDRPNDIKQVLDYAEEMNAPDGALAGLIDMQNVAVVGHSYGGYTALAMAGAQYDLDAFNARCAQLLPDDPNTFLCAPLVPKEADMAARAGLDPMPEGLWPSFGDPRVTAIVPMAGDSYLFDQAGLSKITVPMMAIGGTADTSTPYEWGSKPSYDYASSAHKTLVTFEGGEHFIAISCESMPWWSETPFYGWVCFDPVWDKDRSIDLVNHFTTAFLLTELKGDAEAATALAAENVSFPGIQYQELGYSEAPEIGSADEVQPRGLRPDAPPYAVHGPFAVGTQEFVIETSKRTTPITVWYPALNPGGKPEAIAYRMDVGDEGLPQYPVLGNAILNAAPDLSGAPYPLVVWSHGAYLYRQTNAYLAEHLASQGFVVVAGNHEDNWGTFPAPNVTSDISRPIDISAWIDFAEEQTAADSELAGLIDTERIAVGGHSYGGYTALTVAGALYNPTWYLDVVCADNTLAEDDPLNACSATEKALDELAALAGLDAVPEGLWPSRQDPRVDAIFLLAPSSMFGAEGSAPVTIPTMSLTGSDDPMQDAALHVYLTHENLGSANKSLVVFQGGGHTMFLNDCTSATGMAGVAFEWCSDSVWDTDRVHDLTNYFATAFLKAELYGDAEAATALAAENVSFPGIQYEETGYDSAKATGPEIFQTGAVRHSAQGMAFDSDGLLWITDLIGDNISALNPETGEIVHSFGGEQGIYAPADLVFAPDGTLYWVDWGTSAVGKIDKDGVVTRVTELPPGANAIVSAPDGRLFVASCNMGDSAIYEIYSKGDKPPRLIRGDLGFCAFRFGDWGSDGFFYGARTDLGEIARIDVETGEMTTVAAKLGNPGDVKFDSAGHLIAADVTSGEVYRLDPTTGTKTVLATLDPGMGALVLDSKDHLYVSNEVDGSIVEVQKDGTIRQVNAGGLIAPGSVAMMGNTLYVADFLSIRGYDPTSGERTVMIPRVYGVSDMNDPLSIAADGDNLLITTWFYNTVQIIDPKTGGVLATYDDFNTPTNAIRFQGDLIVTELGSGSVVRASGTDPAKRETLIQNLQAPTGLVASVEDVWVSDSATGTVWQVIAAGKTLSEPKAVATNLSGPEGLALAADGRLLVVEASAGRLSAIDLTTGDVQTLAEGLQTGVSAAGAASSWPISGVVVDASGAIFVGGFKGNLIYRIPPKVGLDDATVAKIDSIVQQAMTDFPPPGFEMCVVKDGKVVYNKGFGLADVAGGRPMTPRSVSTQASISKSLTAMAIMQLAEQGKIDLDNPVTAYLPDFTMADPRYKDITVRMLLSHMSGLPDVPSLWDAPLDQATDPLEQAVRSLSDQQLLSAPGEEWNYSGWGYSTLGDIIAKVSGEPFASYMQQHLLQPMDMANSTFVMDEVDPDLYVTGYITAEDGSAAAMEHSVDARDVPANGFWSNCEDMIKWAQFMLNKGELNGTRVLQPESIDAMWTSVASTPWMDALGPWYGPYVGEYGLGWYVGEKSGHRLAGHAGAGDGVNTQIQFAPADGLAVIAMDNWLKPDPDWYPAGFAAFDVMDLMLGLEPEAEPAAHLDDATAAKIETILTTTMQAVAVPGYAMCVVKDGAVVYNKGFGVTKIGGDQPVTPQSVFSVRSTTKSFTAVALMQLVEQGKVDLDAPITTYLPYFTMADPAYKEITVRMLASHTSGLIDDESFQNMPPRSEEPAETGAAIEWFVRALADDTLTAAPPTDWQYAGTNFILLGDIIGKVSGEPYDVYITRHLLDPLGMTHSTFDAAKIPFGALVGEHMTNADGVVAATPFSDYSGFESPEGGIYSNCADMTRWMQVNLNRGELDGVRILQTKSYDILWKTEAQTGLDAFFGGWAGQYGLGWGVAEDGGHFLAGHPGGGAGQNIGYQLAPNDNLGVTVLANWGTEPDAFPAWTAAADVIYSLLGIEKVDSANK